MAIPHLVTVLLAGLGAVRAQVEYPDNARLAACPGYRATNVKTTPDSLTADLALAGRACDVYGTDLVHLRLEVTYETDSRLHVKIQDANDTVYQVPESVFPRPGPDPSRGKPQLRFAYQESPFSFSVARAATGEVLFDTAAAPLVFESQYLRLRTRLPRGANIYGLGEHSDPLRLPPDANHVRTLWAQDAYGVPDKANLYGTHPVYFEHRGPSKQTHGVFLLNSNGMDVVLGDRYLEYNALGGVLDFYFLAGPDPVGVARQYAEVAGLPAMMPYWSLGFQQCRYGYRDAFEVAEVVYNYSAAGIPLETMWTDIDYMDRRRGFTLDPDRFPLAQMRALVGKLHAGGQKYVLMVNPSIAYQESDYAPLRRALDSNVLLQRPGGGVWKGVVWPGVVGFPDWFHPNTSRFWDREFGLMFDPRTGVDIDGLWIDMNEPSNFPCFFPCDDPDAAAVGFPPEPPPVRSPPRPLPGWPCEFQPEGTECERSASPPGAVSPLSTRRPVLSGRAGSRQAPTRKTPGSRLGLPGRDLLFPKYAIHNKAAHADSWNAERGGLSNKTVNTDVVHAGGLAEYDVHNLYGTMMSAQCRETMASRRPGVRPMVITRSTFAGAGAKVGKWLGDNHSSWWHYRLSVRSVLAFTAVYQVPMVGVDVCGFGGDADEELCARWAVLGAFAPFYRNHNELGARAQEFYQWDSVASAARRAIATRYRLLDYLYTAMARQSADGTPVASPMFFLYPTDPSTFGLDLQYFFGPGLLVAPVTEPGSTSVDVYLPRDVFYDFHTHRRIQGRGRAVAVGNQTLADIPLLMRGGVIFPLRLGAEDAMTTAALRDRDFELVVPLGADGRTAAGELYLDDGESLAPQHVTRITFSYDHRRGLLKAVGEAGFDTRVRIKKVTVLGGDGRERDDSDKKVVQVDLPLGEWEVEV